jgi:hypothetical protein
MTRRRGLFTTAGLIALVAVTTAVAAVRSPSGAAGLRPVIASPTTVPASPHAGKPFTVTFHVTRSDTGALLSSGTMTVQVTVAGDPAPHSASFKNGTARVTMVLPLAAAGEHLQITLTIRSGGVSATRTAVFPVLVGTAPPPPPTTTTTTTPAPTTTTTPARQAVDGQYCGFTGTGGGICFTVGGAAGSQYITDAKFQQTTYCQPDNGYPWQLTITFPGPVAITGTLTFTYSVDSGQLTGSKIDGTFDSAGNGTGSLWMNAAFDDQGTHYTCATKTDWTAKKT